MQFDQAAIHNLAAEMFWRMADECGVQEVNERVLATEGRCLLEHRFDGDLWRDFPLASLPDDEATRVLKAVAFEAFDYTRAQKNMIGEVCLDDRQTGRSPSAVGIDTRQLAQVPTYSCSRPVERLGRLCLRHPLPAVVFADRAPTGSLVQVDDTVTALGFDIPVFLSLAGVQQVDDEAYLLVGYFLIPVVDVPTGDLWSHVIQNSTRNMEGMTFYGFEGDQVIRFAWPAKRSGLFSWLGAGRS